MKGGARQGAGRKKGSGQAAHYRAMLEPYAEELIQRVVGMAKEGDMAALRLCLDRLCAPLRPTDRLVTIEGMADAKELSDKGELILTNAAKGEITPSEAQSLIPVRQIGEHVFGATPDPLLPIIMQGFKNSIAQYCSKP